MLRPKISRLFAIHIFQKDYISAHVMVVGYAYNYIQMNWGVPFKKRHVCKTKKCENIKINETGDHFRMGENILDNILNLLMYN